MLLDTVCLFRVFTEFRHTLPFLYYELLVVAMLKTHTCDLGMPITIQKRKRLRKPHNMLHD